MRKICISLGAATLLPYKVVPACWSTYFNNCLKTTKLVVSVVERSPTARAAQVRFPACELTEERNAWNDQPTNPRGRFGRVFLAIER